MFFIPLSLSAFHGAYSVRDERSSLPFVLILGGVASLAIGVGSARRSARNDAAIDPDYVFRKGLYLADAGALVVQGVGKDDDDLRFYPRPAIEGVAYVRAGRTSRTKLVFRDEAPVFAHALDVRPIVEAWLARRG